MVDLCLFQLSIATLPTDEIPGNEKTDDSQGECAAPVDGRVAEKEVFHDVVVPAAHAEADVQDGPLPELGGEIVLFIRIRDKGIVGGHHGDIQVGEIAHEGGFVGARIPSGYYAILSELFNENEKAESYASRSNETRRSNECRRPEVCYPLHT